MAAVRRALEADRESWQEQFRAPAPSTVVPFVRPPEASAPEQVAPQFVSSTPSLAQSSFAVEPQKPSFSPPRQPPSKQPTTAPSQFQILGVLNKLYVLMENADGLVLVDQHAAHERILFEELRRRMEEKGVPSQRLLLSHVIELAPRDAEWIEQNMATLRKMGLGVEEFGRHTFKLESLPPFLSGAEPGPASPGCDRQFKISE